MSFFTPARLIIASIILVAGTLTANVALAPLESGAEASLKLNPQKLIAGINTPIKLEVLISADTPVNAFSGEVVFNSNLFSVDKIEYNTEVADLWVTLPWYSKADNTIYFAGGTTKQGGFTGSDRLITIYLSSQTPGQTVVSINNPRVLKSDGLGSDTILASGIDSVISLMESDPINKISDLDETNTEVTVTTPTPSFDINNDGKISFSDIAVTMLQLGTNNPRFDFNLDGSVTTADLSMMFAVQKAN